MKNVKHIIGCGLMGLALAVNFSGCGNSCANDAIIDERVDVVDDSDDAADKSNSDDVDKDDSDDANDAVDVDAPDDTTDDSDDSTDDSDDVDDLGELYYKGASDADIVFNEEYGVSYVKNQLLISAMLGTNKEDVEEAVAEVGAEIVGYIEITSDFQIEFFEDKSLDELVEIAEYLYTYPWANNVTLNLVNEVGVEID
ncbi:MAG: hypothetical protein MJ130_10580 [Lachnospiraceae bacterium]|nr:hypothetical protein [Lachnospiraceae bacterium]